MHFNENTRAKIPAMLHLSRLNPELNDQVANVLQRTHEMLGSNFDPADPVFISLLEELERLMEKDPLTDSEVKPFEALQSQKKEVDAQILKNYKMLDNEDYVQKMIARLVISELKNKHHIELDAVKAKRVYGMVVKEYMSEDSGVRSA
jgi:type I restriction enzyme R subunit